ncbi:hypothetical protein NliqN6_1418 [Naganishia liquefaciens]|uniref:Uncharacterized protein n=1 Tax=Naganishia liquefaciens TaxID=104408 RepID=A0A8H3YES3_9TREE|nr:hypothetical protein NliqN6_1418 [Naganishia liquefaciens]
MSGSYIIKFKKEVSDEEADKFYSEISKQGGKVEEKQHGSSFLPRATAVLPESFAQQLNTSLKAGDHDMIEYIEPNGEVKVSPLPGNLPNTFKEE